MNKVIEQLSAGNLAGNTYGGQTVGQITAGNGYVVTVNPDNGRLRDTNGRYGYTAHFTGAYVCYTCGHMCECGDSVDTDTGNTCESCGVIDPVGVEIMHLNTCALIDC